MVYNIIIAGAGLAGASAALVLSRDRKVLVLDSNQPASGASGAAAGLVNPFMGRGSLPAWRHREALAALKRQLSEAGASDLFTENGLIRPVRSEDRRDSVRRAAAAFPEELRYLEADAVANVAPGLVAPLGALHVLTGGSISIPALVDAYLRTAASRGATIRADCGVIDWSEEGDVLRVETAKGPFRARRLILASGREVLGFRGCSDLPLHAIKGQTVLVERPAGYALPPVSGPAYVVPSGDHLVVGASFEHSFRDLKPSKAVSDLLVAQAIDMVPALAGVRIVEERAGVRLTIPASFAPGRLPLLAELPNHAGVWVFAGLGAKGLMTAPLIATTLPNVLDGRAAVHPDLARLQRTS